MGKFPAVADLVCRYCIDVDRRLMLRWQFPPGVKHAPENACLLPLFGARVIVVLFTVCLFCFSFGCIRKTS